MSLYQVSLNARQNPRHHSLFQKRNHAYAYMKRLVDSELVDRSAYAGQDKTLILPYRRLRFLYGEYDFFCRTNHIPLRALENTFRRAYRELKQEYAMQNIPVKFSECRGNTLKVHHMYTVLVFALFFIVNK